MEKENMKKQLNPISEGLKYVPFFYLLFILLFLSIGFIMQTEQTLEMKKGDEYRSLKLDNINNDSATFTFDGEKITLKPGKTSNVSVRDFSWVTSSTSFELVEIKDSSVTVEYSLQTENNILFIVLYSLIFAVVLSVAIALFKFIRKPAH